MNTIMHIEYSNILYNLITKRIDVKLDKYYFTKGNIIPDFKPKYIKTSHSFNQDNNRIFNKIINLYNIYEIKSKREMEVYSENLGIILHYLTDFFCYAHSSKFNGNTFNHFIYEAQLWIYFKNNYDKIMKEYLNLDIEKLNINNILNLIYKNFYNYNCLNNSYLNDIEYSLKICSIIAISSINISMLLKMKSRLIV